MKKSLLLGFIVVGLPLLTSCSNSTNELNDHFEQLERSNVRLGVLDLFQRNDVRRPIDSEVELSLYEKCAAFFESNPDLGSLKNSLVYEEFLKLAMSDEEGLLAPFLKFKESQDQTDLSPVAQNLILAKSEQQEVATTLYAQYMGSPELRDAKSYIMTNQDSPKFKPLGICLAQEMFVTLYGEPTDSSEALLEINNNIENELIN